MAKQLLFNEDARSAMKKGIDKLADAVRMTLGPRGRAVVIEKGYGAPQVTLDGVTVAKEIELEDKFENLGAELIKQAADKTNDNVGDGTTTSIVLAHKMIEEGEKAVREKGLNVILLADNLKQAGEAIVKQLEEQKEPINDSKKIREVASLSSKDKKIGELIAEVMDRVGKDGVVTIEDSNTVGNSYELVEGMQFDRGYISQYMVSNTERMEAVLENPYVLVTDKKISSIQELLPILEKVVQSGKKELVIVAEEVEGEALATLILNKLRGIFNVLAVKAPGFGDRRKEMLQDICVVTGAQFVSEELGKKFDSVDLHDLGQVRRAVSTKDNTTLVGGNGSKEEIEQRVTQLKNQLKKTDSEFDKEKLQERIGKLSGGVAVIKVGSPTESAQKELKQRVEDAVAATRAAIDEGIVPGGGIALFNVYELTKQNVPLSEKKETEAAFSIIGKALRAPLSAIITNSGESAENTIKDLVQQKVKTGKKWLGFNALTNQISDDLRDAGVIDPLKVTKIALMNAISVAATYLTIGAAVTDKPEPKEKSPSMPPGGMGGMDMGM
jgi:chaperonin GroEL